MIGLENPKTIRDKMICLVYEERKPEPRQDFIKRLLGEIFNTLDHVPIEYEAYMMFLKPITEVKKAELAASSLA